jgi:hypothetical protein
MNFLIKGLVMRHYRKFLSNEITEYFLSKATPVVGVEGLKEIGVCGGLETTEGLNFLCELYTLVSSELDEVLEKRVEDRELLDQHCGAIGVKNSKGEIVFGPLNENYLKANSNAVAPLPEFLKGPHVTLFGPPG